MNKTPKCYSYSRFSRPEQSQGNSLSRQRKKAADYAAQHNLVLDKELTLNDPGLSAYKGTNIEKGALGAFLALVKDGRIPKNSILVVEALDRLTRLPMMDSLTIFMDIIRNDIIIITAADEKIYSKASINSNPQDLMESITMLRLAHKESLQKSDRLCDAWADKRKNISTTKLTGKCPAWLQISPDKTHFLPIEERTSLIRRIFELSFSGMGSKSIAKQFNIERIPEWHTRKRKTTGWQGSYIHKILNTRAVLGEFQPHCLDKNTKQRVPEGDAIVDYFPQIIDVDYFYAVQARIKQLTHISGKTGSISNLFGGIAKCAYCRAPMQIVDKGKPPKGGKYLACDNARRGLQCNYCAINYVEFESAFLSYFREADARTVLNLENSLGSTKLSELQLAHESQTGELLTLTKTYENLDSLLATSDDPIASKYLLGKISDIIKQQTSLNQSIETTRREINSIITSTSEIEAKIESILFTSKSLDESTNTDDRIAFRRRLRNEIRQLVNVIVIYPRGLFYSDPQIEKVRELRELESRDLTGHNLEAHIAFLENEIEGMRSTQHNTKDNRFFTIHFKNGNYRTLKYSSTSKTYHVSADRMEDRLNWSMNGKPMKPIDIGDEARLINSEIAQYQKDNLNLTDDDIEGLRRYLEADDDITLDARVDEGSTALAIRIKSSPFPLRGSAI